MSWGQETTVTIGDGTVTSNTNPIGTYYNYSITEQLYTADEIGMAGTISSISFYYMGNAAKDLPITVYMANVDAEDLSAGGISLADADEVFTGTLSVPATAGWVTIELDNPFTYNGTSNLLIGCIKDYLYYFSGQTWQGTATTSTMARYTQNDSNPYTTSTTPGNEQANRPNIQLVITPSGDGPTCPKPDELTAIGTPTDHAFSFSITGGSGLYNIEIKAGNGEWTNWEYEWEETTVELTGLTPLTNYQVRVQSVCNDITDPETGDALTSGWKTLNFSTAAGIPLVETFGTSLPTNWALYNGLLSNVMNGTALSGTSYGWNFGTSNNVFDSHARVNIYGTSCNYWLVTPALTMEDNVQLMFDLALTAYSTSATEPSTTGTDDRFVVLISTDNMATWTILREWNNSGSEYVYNNIASSATGQSVAIDLSSYAGQSIQIAFYGESTVSNADNNLHIDNVSIDYIPSCPNPLALAVNYTGGTEATVSWNSDATAFNIDVNGTVTAITTNPYTLSDLELATTYEVKVQADCGSNGTSEWTAPVSFTTDLCMPEDQCEITLALTDSYGDGWNGGQMQVVDALTEKVLGTFTLPTSTSSQTFTLAVCNGRDINFVYTQGSYGTENGWVITDIDGEVITEREGCNNGCNPTDGIQATYTVDCGNGCPKPSAVTANGEPTAHEFSFTIEGGSGLYNIFTNAGNGEWTNWEYEWEETTVDLTDLTENTAYKVRVQSVCTDMTDPETGDAATSKWMELSFHTIEACPAPTDLTITLTSNSAEIVWDGDADSYKVRYREANAESYNFDASDMSGWTTIDADGDGNDWVLGSAAGGVYLVEGGSLAGTGHNSSADLMVSGSYSNVTGVLTPDNYLVSPQVQLGGTITFYAGAQDASYAAEHFGVAVSTTGNTDAADFTTIAEWTLNADGTGSSAKDQGVWSSPSTWVPTPARPAMWQSATSTAPTSSCSM